MNVSSLVVISTSGIDSTSKLIRAEITTVFETHGLRLVSDLTRTNPSTFSLLDLIINGADSRRVFKVAVRPTHGVSDHDLVTWLAASSRCVQTYSFRSVKNVNWQQFRSDVYSSKLFTASENTADGFADQTDVVVTQILDNVGV